MCLEGGCASDGVAKSGRIKGMRTMQREKDRRIGLRLVPVSRETEERLTIFVGLLARWRHKTNLVSQAAFDSIWMRHIADSAQVLLLNPRGIRWIDMGSGAGFPGMVLAIQLAGVRDAVVHCVESDQRKCSFLREVARSTGAPAIIHAARVQSLRPFDLGIVDGVAARAFAPLPTALEMAQAWLHAGAIGVFPRGKSTPKQLESLSDKSDHHIEVVPSVVDAAAFFLRIKIC